MDFADDSDVSFTLRNDIQNIFGNVMRLTMLKGSPSDFQLILNLSVTTEKRLVSNISADLELYARGKFECLGCIESKYNLPMDLAN